MTVRRLLWIAVGVLFLTAVPDHAGAVVLGGGYGQTEADIEAVNDPFDIDDQGWKVYAGYMFSRIAGIEAGYTKFADFSDSNADARVDGDSDAIPVFVVVTLPLRSFEIFGKVGGAAWDLGATVDDGTDSIADDDDGIDFAVGAGLGYGIVPGLVIRVEYEYFDIGGTDSGLEFATLGLQLRF